MAKESAFGYYCRTGEGVLAKPKIIYIMIQEYVKKKYGFRVHIAYIAEVKRALRGDDVYYN